MAALIIETNNPQNLELITQFAKQLGSKVKSISANNIEDLLFGEIIDKAKTGEYASKEDLMKMLSSGQ